MLHCHQFAHHPSVRPAKLSSLFGNSSNSSHSCILQQLNANINDALTSDGAQYWNGKRHRCIRNRIRRQFQGTSVATALQAYDLQEQIRRISFHERIEFFNLFQHQNKYFPNATNSRKRTRNLQTATTTDSTMPNHNWLNDLSVAQISEMIRKTEKDKREKMRTETDSRESVHSAQPNGTALDYVHTTLFGPNFSGKILNAKPTRQRRHSAPSTAEDTQPSFMNSSGGFFSHFPAQSLSLVGVGGFGRVYRIQGKQNAFNDERLAVKIIPFNSSKGSDHQEKTKDGRNKYGTPILSAAAMIAALHDEEEQQRALEESSTEKQVLREVSVLSALSSRNTARYRWAWVEKWSDQFADLFNTRSNHRQRRSISTPSVSPSASISDSASFSDTSSEWSSSNSSVSSSMSEDETESESSETELVSSSVVAGSSKPKYDSVLVLLMDYYVGISLSEFIANPSAHLPACMSHTSVLSSLFRLYLSYQILTSLEYLHAHKCIHRDLAPKNLILEIDRALLSSNACNVVDEQRMDALLVRLMSNQVSADDVQDSEEWKSICSILAAFNVRLIDFGLSRHFGKVPNKTTSVDDTTTHNNMEFSVGVGTRSYAPPEQLHRTSSCTCKQSGACNVCNFADRGDIYSCGLLLSEMLCAPFNTQMERIDFLSRMRDRRWNQMESFQTLPKLLKDLLCSMINSVPNARPSASEAKKSKAFHAVRKLLPFIAAARYEHCAA